MTTIREVLLARAEDLRPGLLSRDSAWTWQEYVAESARRAHAVAELLDPARPAHVGLLMDNTPQMAFQLGAAGLGAHVAVGLNTTRRGAALAADIVKADCQVVLVDPRLAPLLDDCDLGGVRVLRSDDSTWTEQVAAADPAPPEAAPQPESLFMLIFTSGTSGEPKAVRITHEKVTFPGAYLTDRLGLGRDDVFYVSMPLFHSNSVMAGWGPALVCGATVALAERFSASRLLEDLRNYGATYLNYVGKPLSYVLATPERPDDADNPLRLAFGNEAGDRDIKAFSERFGCTVVDGFGSTENAVVISRIPGTPAGALGVPLEGVAVLDAETQQECPRAVFDVFGRVLNLEEATGELVNTTGAGQFAGYYRDEEATSERMRGGMYWSGDLAYRDQDGFVYYAGRTADWLRVDGENLAAAPIERILVRHPAIAQAAVYAVPDPSSGDQLVAALVLVGDLTPGDLEQFLAVQADLGPKQWPRHVRLLAALPRTATHKVLKRDLRAQGLTGGTLWTRAQRGTSYTGTRGDLGG
jgi:fatty-acyl-CoA synthase